MDGTQRLAVGALVFFLLYLLAHIAAFTLSSLGLVGGL